MPDCVCCVFRAKGKRKEHTGMHLGGGVVIDCSTGVSSVGMRGWTHYGVPVGLYSEGEIPVETVKPVLRKGDRGDNVRELQERLNELGYDCGTADGVFGTRTFNALVCFQTDAGIDPDGACGPVTRRALAAALPAPAPLWRVVIGGLTAARRDEVLQMFPHAACGREG
ncbi:MAG: peptidoglycan-binding protein [Clostridia bacterium]|nr:peptidoglycan-binding protein [Clostridia bacterium]